MTERLDFIAMFCPKIYDSLFPKQDVLFVSVLFVFFFWGWGGGGLGNKVLSALEKIVELFNHFFIMWTKIWGLNWNMWVICPFQTGKDKRKLDIERCIIHIG